VFTTENVATVAPMPSASVITATSENPGDFRSERRLKRTSWTAWSIAFPPNVSRHSSLNRA
jgi:hypothetical protein